jgi:hypothetical protein
VVTVQVPTVAQQAPVAGSAHGFGVQVVLAPRQVLGDVHAACVVTVQVLAGAQQAPVGWRHGFGVHVVLAPCHVLGLAQAACVVTVHVPVAVQQAPGNCFVSVMIPRLTGSQSSPLQL